MPSDLQFNSSTKPWGLEAQHDKTRLNFSGTFDKQRVLKFQAKKTLDNTITIALCALGIIGLTTFCFEAYVGFTTNDIFFVFNKNPYNFIFALSLYTDLYLWSNLRRNKHLKQNLNLVQIEEQGMKQEDLDVYNLFDQHSKQTWDEISKLISDSKTFPNTASLITGLCNDPHIKLALSRLRISYKDILLDLAPVARMLNEAEERELVNKLPFLALKTALDLHARSISSLIVFYTLLKNLPTKSPLVEIFREYELNEKSLEVVCRWQISIDIINSEIQSVQKYSKYKTLDTNKGLTSIPTPYLNQFSTDLTAMAKYGHLPFAYGREQDLEEIFKLFSDKIRFVAIKGAEGTGRSTILNELAYRMVSEEVPPGLQDQRLVRLEISSIIGSNVAPETVLLNALAEAEHNDNIMLAIEEIHLLAKAQGAHGLNLLQIFINHLQESNLMVIATTTPGDYQDSLHGVSNFEQLFNVFELKPLPEAAIIQSVCVKATMLENKYNIFFTYDAIVSATKFTTEYFAGQGQPQAAISLLTEVATKTKNGPKGFVSQEDIEKAVSEKSHVPTASLSANEPEKLLDLERKLSEQVIGQKAGIAALANAIKRSRSGLSGGTRPVGSFLFVGPTGVGKTEAAKALARIYFGDEKFFLRLDMSEFQGANGMEKLLGRNGDKTDTIFIKHLKDYPFCLLLLDEFEKASREIWNLFLQVLDDGRITTVRGETLNLKNTIIIATSNAGTTNIQDGLRQGISLDKIKTGLLNDILLKTFPPELLNRFDDIILFSPLTPEEISQVVGLFLNALATQLKQSKDVDFSFSPEASELIAQRGYDAALGARPIRRYIQDHVDTLVAESILKNPPHPGVKFYLDVQNNELALTVSS